jgi:hypothetical protein
VVLGLLLAACASSPSGHHPGTSSPNHKRSTGTVSVRTSLEGGPLNPKTHRSMLDNKPVRNVRISVVSTDGRHWRGRTGSAGTRTFKLPPGRYVVRSDWCGARHTKITVQATRVLPVRYACPVP